MNCEIKENGLGSKTFHSKMPFQFVKGGYLPELFLVYETFGTLNSNQDNVILLHHALSTSSHVCSSPQNPAPGWWQNMVGAGCPIDTNRYFVICVNNLGSCFGSSGPTTLNPETQRPYQTSFPELTIEDMVRAQFLLLDYLGIKQLHAVVGASMGAMLSLTAAALFPTRITRLISISSCYRSYPITTAIRSIQRDIIRLDPAWENGYYAQNPQQGFVLARKLGHLTYRNAIELNHRFTGADFGKTINDYLQYNAQKFVAQFDANSYLYLTQAMDEFDLTHGYTDRLEPFKKILAKTLVISVNSDTLFIPEQQAELVQHLEEAHVPTEFIHHESTYGHDAFLVEARAMGVHIERLLKTP